MKAIAAGIFAGVITLVSSVAWAASRRKALTVGQSVVSELQTLIGTPYIWGGKNPQKAGGLDCSGAVTYVLAKLDLVPPGYIRNADQLFREAERILLPQAGDLAFYGTSADVSHVMVVVGDGRVLGATGGGRSTTSTEIAKKQGAEIKYEPLSYRKDLVGYGRPRAYAAAQTMV